ncbi:phosphatase PAP2-related protein [Mucilaginibacter terrae]|uniref:CHASE2 domain-containing sensor protein n=1 Tax=Mucilaginibacter terrae TaxID=1955052 RepID=A0ABU3GRM8_9SPHI|nr:phosphatase PAP2-related protein [Mucilaginibacter terrae]MDT3402417.1 CHASE2 domain-containing sensor protein [Mucilaginibacter terrae]
MQHRNTTITLKQNWKATWNSASQRSLMIIGSVIVALVLSGMPIFFQHIEQRPGVQLHDFILSRVPAYDVSLYIFLIEWGMGLLILARAIKNPAIYVRYVWLYIVISLTRLLTITLVPLAPPANLVELVDPITGVFYGHAVITKDLFYSGHTSTLIAMYFCLPRKPDRYLVIVATIAMACLLIVQHVHYTIDILAAPVFVFLLNRILQNTLLRNVNIEGSVQVSNC